jgi:O-antigen ligase
MPATLVLAGVVAAFVTARLPGILLAAYFLIPFYKGVVQPLSPIDLTVGLAVLNAVQFVPVVLARRRAAVPGSGVVLWVALAALIAAGVLYAPDQKLAFDTLVNWVLLVLVPLLGGGLRVAHDERFVRQFIVVLFVTSALAVVAGIATLTAAQRLVIPGMDTIGMGRAAMLLPLLAATFVLREPGMVPRAAAVMLIPAALVVAIASGSRGPLVVGALLFLAWVARSVVDLRFVTWRRLGAVAIVAAAVLVAVSTLATALPEAAVVRFVNLGEFVGNVLSGESASSTGDVTAGQRVRLFDLALVLFQEHPLFGTGTAGYEALAPLYIGREASAYPHNAVLQFASDFGLLGVLVFAVVSLWVLRRPIPAGAAWWSVRALLVFFLLNAMVSGGIYTDRQLWLLVVLILVAAWPRSTDRNEAGGPRVLAVTPLRPPVVRAENAASRTRIELPPATSTSGRHTAGAVDRPIAP